MKLSTAEIESLNVYVEAYGRNWKAILRHDWQTGQCSPYGAEHGVIQGLRNRSDFGPAGLVKLKQIDLEPTPATLPDYQRKEQPVQEAVWRECVREAKENKRWAVKTNKSAKWKANASDMSKQMLVEYLTSTIREMATKAYTYWRHRAHLVQGRGHGVPAAIIDPAARKRWLEFGTLESDIILQPHYIRPQRVKR